MTVTNVGSEDPPIRAAVDLPPSVQIPKAEPYSELTPKQLECYGQVLEHFAALEEQTSDNPLAPLTEAEQFYLSRETLLRFLRATKWKTSDAIARLEKTVEWRREWKVESWTGDYIDPEQTTGKQLLYGYDLCGRPMWYMRPSKQNTSPSPRQLHHMFFYMTLSECLMPRGVETVSLLINFQDRSTQPNFKQAREALNILQNHYPERLGMAYVINLPWIVQGFFTIMTKLLDPVTRAKLYFSNDLTGLADEDQLDKAFGGNVSFKNYQHDLYWKGEKGIVALAMDRRNRAMDKWRSLGGRVGLKEWDFKATI